MACIWESSGRCWMHFERQAGVSRYLFTRSGASQWCYLFLPWLVSQERLGAGSPSVLGRHCCVSEPRSMPLFVLLRTLTPGDGAAASTGCVGLGSSHGAMGGSPKLLVSIPDHPSQLLQRGLHCSGGDAAHIQPLSCSGVLANVHRTCLRSQGRPVLPCLTHPCCHVPSRLARRGTVGLQGGSQVWTPMGCPVCL